MEVSQPQCLFSTLDRPLTFLEAIIKSDDTDVITWRLLGWLVVYDKGMDGDDEKCIKSV